ncbi:TPA: hypothetical protein U4W96_000183 [Streptococcus agalactiae]|uniref:hypothetical protein n=1 Tax=Streptococcus agalactiae TaxID=1311 RepID=UPI000D6FB34F|nr:hypothetical protein [Streptococcus agalactiae]PWT25383.1 hypothetical protein CUZ34_01260 [Streptococcus agalactiae]HEN3143881.1 hypothetical protein [Streptococcus agalactiae]
MKTFYVTAEYRKLDVGCKVDAENIFHASLMFVDFLKSKVVYNTFDIDELLIKEVEEIEVKNDK